MSLLSRLLKNRPFSFRHPSGKDTRCENFKDLKKGLGIMGPSWGRRGLWTLFQALLIFLSMMMSAALQASNPDQPLYTHPFVVEGVEVDVSSSSSHEARLQAIGLAQQKAFVVLLSRFTDPKAIEQLQALSEQEIEKLVQDMEVIQEKFSAVRYVATFLVRFKEEALQKILSPDSQTEGYIPLSKAGKGWVVIPLFKGSQPLLWQEENPLLQHFQQHFQRYEGLTLALPFCDLEDIKTLDVHAVLTLNKINILKFLERYKIGRGLVVSYETNTHELRIFNLDPQGVDPLWQQFLPEETLYQTLPSILEKVLPKNDQKVPLKIPFEPLTLWISLADTQEWKVLYHRLQTSPWVKEVIILHLSAEGVKLSFQLKGREQGLAFVFPDKHFQGQWPFLKMVKG